jgi:hypothetical protein
MRGNNVPLEFEDVRIDRRSIVIPSGIFGPVTGAMTIAGWTGEPTGSRRVRRRANPIYRKTGALL